MIIDYFKKKQYFDQVRLASSGVIGCHRVVVGSVFIEIVKKSIKIMKIIRK